MTTLDPQAAPIAIPIRPDETKVERHERFRLLVRSPTFLLGCFLAGIWVVCAIFGNLIAPHDPVAPDILSKFEAPSGAHLFGTDKLGQDVLSRVIVGARSVLVVAPLATILGTVLGTTIGLVTGYYRGFVDEAIMRVVDAILAIPLIITALLAITAVGPSRKTLILVIGFVFTPIIAKTVRAAVLGEAQLEYVQAARLRNERGPYVMFAEILPNVTGPIIVEFTVRLGYAIFTVATLAFLGFAADPTIPDWGQDISAHYQSINARLLVAGALPLARHRDAHRRNQPDRGCDRAALRAMTDAAIELQDLQIAYTVRGIDRRVLRGVSFSIGQGESYGLVGESGCGKTTAAFAIMRYLPRNAKIQSGSIRLNGEDMLAMSGGKRPAAAGDDALDGLPEPGLGPEPVDPGRAAARRSIRASRRRK